VLVAAACTGAIVLSSVSAAQPPDPLPPKCDRPNPPVSCGKNNPTGRVDGIARTPGGLEISGVATDPDATGPVSITVEVGGHYAGSLSADGPGGVFSGTLVPIDGDQVCVTAINRNLGDDTSLGCRALTVRTAPFGHLDEVTGGPSGRIRGWAIDPDIAGSVSLELSVENHAPEALTAAAGRPDVAAAYPLYGPGHGFDVARPIEGHPRVCVRAANVGPGPASKTLIGCAVATQDPGPVPAGTETMSIATLNIIGSDATAAAAGLPSFGARLGALAEAVAGFDVVGLQEVASPNEVAQLAERAGYRYYTVATGSGSFPDQGFLSRVPLTDVHTYEGPKTGCVLGINCGGPVWILVATTELHGKPIRVISTHLSGDYMNENGTGNDRSAWRAEQARYIADNLVAPFAGRVVVIGDFNGNDDLVAPRGPLGDAAAQAPRTVNVAGWGSHCGDRIDLILPRAPMRARFYDGVYGGLSCTPAGVSDHPRVSALLDLNSPTPQPPPSTPAPSAPAPDDRVCASKPWTPGC